MITSTQYIFCRLDVVPSCRPENRNRLCRYLSAVCKCFRTNGKTRLICKFPSAYRSFSALLCSADIAAGRSSFEVAGSNATGTAVLYVSLCVLLCVFSCVFSWQRDYRQRSVSKLCLCDRHASGASIHVFSPSLERRFCPTFSLCFYVSSLP